MSMWQIEAKLLVNLLYLLKVQLLHSLMLSHIDYCNAVFYSLPEYILHKLTKVSIAAMRFVFGLCGSALRMHMQSYLKSLHFLPVIVNYALNSKLLYLHVNACMIILLHI